MSVENSLDTHVLVYLFFAAAIEAGCRTLYSEDLQHGQQNFRRLHHESFREVSRSGAEKVNRKRVEVLKRTDDDPGDMTTNLTDPFFERPILNSPYEYPNRHWELDEAGQPTQKIVESRRLAEFITPIPKPRKRGRRQRKMIFDEQAQALETAGQQYDLTSRINILRRRIDAWRALPDSHQWKVSAETARLLRHWRHHRFSGIRPFFCQVEAVETAILAHRGGAAVGTCREGIPRPLGERQPGRQSGPAAVGIEAGHGDRQDHRHGDCSSPGRPSTQSATLRAPDSPAASW